MRKKVICTNKMERRDGYLITLPDNSKALSQANLTVQVQHSDHQRPPNSRVGLRDTSLVSGASKLGVRAFLTSSPNMEH
jgi:hypothetical protein